MVHNPSTLYTGGAERFNSQPEVALYERLLARRRAKDEAIDEYYKKLPSTLNSAGMRDQDIQGLNEGLAKWQQHWMQNKELIKKGTTKEAFDSEQMLRQLRMGVDQSKNAAKTDLELGKMRFSKENGYIFEDPTFMEEQKKHATPIWDANHKSIDLGTVAIPTEPFTQEKQDKLWGSITKGMDAGKEYDYTKQRINPSTRQVVVPYVKKFSPEQIEKIADAAAEAIKNDKSATLYYQRILDNPNRDEIDELQKAYNRVYKGMITTPEQVAAADAIIRASVPKEQGEEQELQRNAPVIKNYVGGGGKSSSGELTINDVYKRIIESLGDRGAMPVNELDSDVVSFLAAQSKKDPRDIVVGLEGNRLAYYEVSDDGTNRRIGYLTPISVNLKAQPSVKEKREVINQNNKTQKTETRTFVFPNGKNKF